MIVLLGPTAVGKTELSLVLAEALGTEIVSADSRQIYRELDIGTAKPSPAELARVKHHFINHLSPDAYYSAAKYAEEVSQLSTLNSKLMVGGSMLYIDAVTKGIDDIPTIDDDTRQLLKHKLETEGLGHLCEELRLLDPEYYSICDHRNTRRVVHALEICYMTGKPYSTFRQRKLSNSKSSNRPIVIGLRRERQNLFDRINSRVDIMVDQGLLKETETLITKYGEVNALNTVGYKEMINVLKGDWKLDMAIERMKKNTRVYAKKQMTWWQKDSDIIWFDADTQSTEEITDKVLQLCSCMG